MNSYKVDVLITYYWHDAVVVVADSEEQASEIARAKALALAPKSGAELTIQHAEVTGVHVTSPEEAT